MNSDYQNNEEIITHDCGKVSTLVNTVGRSIVRNLLVQKRSLKLFPLQKNEAIGS